MKVGGGRPSHLARGWYLEPTLLTNCTNDMRVAREEIFGPVVVPIPHDGTDDAVAIANDSPFGLSGTVWTEDAEAALGVARRVRTGTFALNTYTVDPTTPFGGYKQSGIGREMGVEGLEGYVELQVHRRLRPVAELSGRTFMPSVIVVGSGSAGASSPPASPRTRTSPSSCWRPVRITRSSSRCPRTSASPGASAGWPMTGATAAAGVVAAAAGAEFGVSDTGAFPCRAERSSAARRRSTGPTPCARIRATSTAGSTRQRPVVLGRRSCPTSAAWRTTRLGGEYHGSDGPMPIRRFTGERAAPGDARLPRRLRAGRARAFGRSNSPGAVGAGPLPVNQVDGVRMSTAITYLMPALERPNLELRGRCNGRPRRAVGRRARAVVLTTGRAPRGRPGRPGGRRRRQPGILQRSGVGPADALSAPGDRRRPAARRGRPQPARPPDGLPDVGGRRRRGRPLDPPLQAFCACTSSGALAEDQIDLNLVPFTLEPGAINVGLGLVRPYSVGHLRSPLPTRTRRPDPPAPVQPSRRTCSAWSRA